MKLSNKSSGGHNRGFTLVELVVVLGVIAVLIVVQLPALAAGKSQSRIGMCAGNVRQLALACQLYANDNNDKLPVLSGSAAWAWDLPVPAADALLKSGLKPKTFYCPGTAPRFTDKEIGRHRESEAIPAFGILAYRQLLPGRLTFISQDTSSRFPGCRAL